MSGFRVRHPRLWVTGLLLVAALVIAVLVAQVIGGDEAEACPKGDVSRPQYTYPVQTFEDLTPPPGSGQRHLAPGEIFDDYNSNPPTNGRHADDVAPWDVSGVPIPKQVAVHNMEHAGVVIWYNCDGGSQPLEEAACRQLRGQLARVVEKAVDDGKKVLMTPYPDMEQRIALTAWQTLDAFDEFDGTHITAFIASFECKFNPEGF